MFVQILQTVVSCSIKQILDGLFPTAYCADPVKERFLLPHKLCDFYLVQKLHLLLRYLFMTSTSVQHRIAQGTLADSLTAATRANIHVSQTSFSAATHAIGSRAHMAYSRPWSLLWGSQCNPLVDVGYWFSKQCFQGELCWSCLRRRGWNPR